MAAGTADGEGVGPQPMTTAPHKKPRTTIRAFIDGTVQRMVSLGVRQCHPGKDFLSEAGLGERAGSDLGLPHGDADGRSPGVGAPGRPANEWQPASSDAEPNEFVAVKLPQNDMSGGIASVVAET